MFFRKKGMVDMQNMLAQHCMNLGLGPVAEMRMVYSSGTADPYLYYRDKINDANLHSTVLSAYNAGVDERNDAILLTPEEHSLAASLTYAKNNTHMIGLGGIPNRCALPVQITHSANFTPVITQSQWWGTWSNFRIKHGRGTASNYQGVSLTGHYNTWKNIDLESPMSTTEGADASLISLNLAGGHNYFEDCWIGNYTRLRSAANQVLNINTNGVGNIFNKCMFNMYTSSSDAVFIYVSSGSGVQNRWTYFKDCVFIAYSVNWASDITVGVKYQYSGGTGHRLIFDNCAFIGVTDIITDDDSYRNNCQFIGGNSYRNATTAIGLPVVST